MKKLFLWVSFIVFFAAHAAAQVKVTAKIDSAEILIGEQTAVRVQVVHPEKEPVAFPKDISTLLEDNKLEIVNKGEIDEHEDTPEEGMTTSVFSFTITSFEPSLYYIPQLNITVGKKNYSTNQLALKVNDVAVDTLHVDKFFGPKEIIEPVYTWQDWMPLFVLSLLLIICVGVLGYAIYLLRRYKEVKEVKVKQEFILPHEEAKRNIEKLKTKYDSGDFTSKDYYTELVSILRDYVTQRYGFSAKEMTSYELVEHLINVPEDKTEKNAGPENNLLANNDKQVNLEELREILTTADLTKFAKLKTEANEDRTNLMRLAGYIDATKNETQRYYYTPVQKEKAQKQIKPGIVLKICLVLFSVAIVAVVAFMVKEVLELFL